jgi:hypothetical protein
MNKLRANEIMEMLVCLPICHLKSTDQYITIILPAVLHGYGNEFAVLTNKYKILEMGPPLGHCPYQDTGSALSRYHQP